MAEIDYQMALLLQHRFEQEHKSSRSKEQSDQELARKLQEQFQQEEAIERPTNNLVYKQPKTGHNSSKSLVDPSWELVDPTPDIHTLFMVFNERYFWNKLLAVCVSWSKKMTSCAGVCSYHGRGGMCSITLSAPLLKLRPRKDLVETLLHEMIHAYLFVTHSNRDRDGHGPEFHKHMFRINSESGTNITVYHDFHDEVRLYQQHWWRCNGPCQSRKPFFGMVRRATNRAPGPNDRWWAEHSSTCDGTFIKVKEPEKENKTKKTQGKNTTNVKSKDIRDFLPVVKSSGSSNIHGFKDVTNTTNINKPNHTVVKNSDSSNVKGFKDLGNKQVKGKFNSTSTIVVTNTKTSSESSFKPTVFNPTISTSNSRSSVKNGETSNEYTDEFLSVRNHWANKFSSSGSSSTNGNNKRPRIDEPSTSSKTRKISENDSDFCECPVCNKKVRMEDLNNHLDSCLEEPKPEIPDLPKEEEKECPLCNAQVESSIFDVHVEKCLMKVYDGVEEQLNAVKEPQETVSCLACGKKIIKSDLNSHLDDCIIDIFDDKEEEKEEKSSSEFNCPFCMKLIEEVEMKEHIDVCLKADNVDVIESFFDTTL